MQYQRFACGFWRKLFVILLVCVPALAFAQEEKESSFYVSADLVSRYVWRGSACGNAPAIQPEIGYSYGNFNVYLWGSADVKDSYREMNIGVSYALGDFTAEIVDYYYPYKGTDFLNFRNSSTTHQAELMLTYEPEAFPLHVMVGSYIYGDDKKENGKNAFSTYAEIGYTHEFNEKNSMGVLAGASLNKGFYTDYTKGLSLVNLAAGYTRIFTLWDYQLPASAEFVYNPYIDKSYFVVKLSLEL